MNQLIWILFAALIGFLVSFLIGNIKGLPVDVYYLFYFGIVSVFFVAYIKQTNFDYKQWLSHNLLLGIVLGLIFAALMAKNVFNQPATTQLTGGMLAWALVWRGLVYGIFDGLLLSVFPYVVAWRTFDVASRPLPQQIGFGLLAWIFVLIVTTAYHFGYNDFRSKKLIQPNIGNTLISFPTFVSGNPVASSITHAGMHIAAVLHAPETDLFLPPHKEK